MINATDRIEALHNQSVLTGIDFIYVHDNQTSLDVYFLRSPKTLTTSLTNNLLAEQVVIYNDEGLVPSIPVTGIAWSPDGEILQLQVAAPGNFVLYRLRIDDVRIDRYYNNITFSFKAGCPSDLDCAPPPHECPPEDLVDFPVDYSARDFWTYRRALLDMASQRYPDWKDRLAADAGVMVAELLSALADEMAYYQDRIGREAFLETATQRRSLRRHARLVDYTPGDVQGAKGWLDVTVKDGQSGNIPAGTPVWAGIDDQQVFFEFGQGLADALAGTPYFVNAAINDLTAYRWDEDQTCLFIGATEVFLDGHHQADLQAGQPVPKLVLLQTTPANPAQPARNQLVHLVEIEDTMDFVLLRPITRVKWSSGEATTAELDLTQLHIRGNIIPVTAGKTDSYYLLLGDGTTDLEPPSGDALQQLASLENRPILTPVERIGANNSIVFFHTLPDTALQPLVWFPAGGTDLSPEIHVSEMNFQNPVWMAIRDWTWRYSLVGVNSSEPESTDYTLDDGSWRRVVGYQEEGVEIIHEDYAASAGSTLRFGDGEFGLEPARKTVFRVHYRYGGGNASNLAPETLKQFDPILNPVLGLVASFTNPLATSGGIDEETPDVLRQAAPQAFKTETFRAVTLPDYAASAEKLAWVQKAGAAARWTGSWTTIFVTPDPLHAVQITDEWRLGLEDQLNRYRQAGREAYTLDPHYADMDLKIEICVAPDSFAAEVEQRVLEALVGKATFLRPVGYFNPDRFTFGTLLDRSTLEATIQEVPGVRAVESVCYRRRGFFAWKFFTDYSYDPGMDTIIRVENDPLHPDRGSLTVHTHGGL
jgi:hypothetical protein